MSATELYKAAISLQLVEEAQSITNNIKKLLEKTFKKEPINEKGYKKINTVKYYPEGLCTERNFEEWGNCGTDALILSPYNYTEPEENKIAFEKQKEQEAIKEHRRHTRNPPKERIYRTYSNFNKTHGIPYRYLTVHNKLKSSEQILVNKKPFYIVVKQLSQLFLLPEEAQKIFIESEKTMFDHINSACIKIFELLFYKESRYDYNFCYEYSISNQNYPIHIPTKQYIQLLEQAHDDIAKSCADFNSEDKAKISKILLCGKDESNKIQSDLSLYDFTRTNTIHESMSRYRSTSFKKFCECYPKLLKLAEENEHLSIYLEKYGVIPPAEESILQARKKARADEIKTKRGLSKNEKDHIRAKMAAL